MFDLDFASVIRQMELENYHYVLLGDGSGTTLGNPCGWNCYLVDNIRGSVSRHGGCLSSGTNNLAELSPYLFGLWHIHGMQPQPPIGFRTRVAIVSDSEVTVRCGSGQYERRANASLWASIAWFEQNGFDITWHHVKRNSNPIHERCDFLAGELRKMMVEAIK